MTQLVQCERAGECEHTHACPHAQWHEGPCDKGADMCFEPECVAVPEEEATDET